MPKENFPWEAIAVLGRVLEENSGKYEPGHWRQVSMIEHKDHAKKHLDNLRNFPNISFFAEDHLAHAFVRLAMAVAVRESKKVAKGLSINSSSIDSVHVFGDGGGGFGGAMAVTAFNEMLNSRCGSPKWHDDWF